MKVWVQKWEESERGWGTRPEGFSLHRTREDIQKFIEEYTKDWPKDPPDEYDRPCGTPYEAEIDGKLLRIFRDSDSKRKHGVRIWKHEYSGYPGDGGPDGWKTMTRKDP